MPIHKTSDGRYQWGKHGKKYPTRAGAEKQAAAAHANGYRGDALEKVSVPRGDALVNAALDFPMSGDGTEDGDILAEDVFLDDDLSGPMGD